MAARGGGKRKYTPVLAKDELLNLIDDGEGRLGASEAGIYLRSTFTGAPSVKAVVTSIPELKTIKENGTEYIVRAEPVASAEALGMPDEPFLHSDESAFRERVVRASEDTGVAPYIVEKDYYITHALFLLERCGFAVHVSGGVSLTKGSGFLRRLSEDVDVTLDTGAGAPRAAGEIVRRMKKLAENFDDYGADGRERRDVFNAARDLVVATYGAKEPPLRVALAGEDGADESGFFHPYWQQAGLLFHYDALFLPCEGVDPLLVPPYVAVEISLKPCAYLPAAPPSPRPVSSLLHDSIAAPAPGCFFENRPASITFQNALVTLLQKISDGIIHRYPRKLTKGASVAHLVAEARGSNPVFDPRIARHYTDVVALLDHIETVAADVKPGIAAVYASMVKQGMLRRKPNDRGESYRLHLHASLSFDDEGGADKLAVLDACREARRCLEHAPLGQPSIAECAKRIREWLQSVGL